MYQANIALPDDVFRQAERKASSEGVSLSEVVRSLVARWVTDEITTSESDTTRQQTLDKAIASYGMWSDRDPDEFLRQSRIGLVNRDRDPDDARVDV